jgi:hypothetical protein
MISSFSFEISVKQKFFVFFIEVLTLEEKKVVTSHSVRPFQISDDMIPSSRFEISMKLTSFHYSWTFWHLKGRNFMSLFISGAVLDPRRTETVPTLLRKPNTAHITCLFLEHKSHWKGFYLTTVSVTERRLRVKLFVRRVGRMTMSEEDRISCRKICLIFC